MMLLYYWYAEDALAPQMLLDVVHMELWAVVDCCCARWWMASDAGSLSQELMIAC